MSSSLAYNRKCKACGQKNELPYVFCPQCGAPRNKLGRMRVAVYISMIFGVFFSFFLFKDHEDFGQFLVWNWPLYLLYGILFTQFSLSLVWCSWRLTLRHALWYSIFFMGFFLLFFFLHRDELGTALYWLTDVPDYVLGDPLMAAGLAGGLFVMIALPAYMRWGRVHGWVNAYRLVVLAFLVASLAGLAGLWGAQRVNDAELLEGMTTGLDDFVSKGKPGYVKILSMTAVSLLRLFAFEIIIFAAVKGYATAQAAPAAAPAALSQESGLTRSLYHLTQVLQRLSRAVENMVRYLIGTLITLSQDLAKAVWAFATEVFFPTIALSACALLCYQIAATTETYVETGSPGQALRIAMGIVGMLLAAMVFLGCKAPFRWRAIVAFYGQMIGWLLPNLLLFFLVLSLSLFGSGAAMNRFAEEGDGLPFRIGFLTKVVAGLLVFLVIVVAVRKRSLLLTPQPAEAPPEPEPPAEPPAEDAPDEEAAPRRGLIGRQKERAKASLAKAARRTGKSLHLDQGAKRALEKAHTVMGRLDGKPRIVDELVATKTERGEHLARIRALEATQDSVSAETYEPLYEQYGRDLASLDEKYAAQQVEVDTMHAQALKDRDAAYDRLKDLETRQAELDHLREAGAISVPDHQAKGAQMKPDLDRAKAELEVAERRIGFLEPHVSQQWHKPFEKE